MGVSHDAEEGGSGDRVVRVALPLPLDQAYDYRVPPDLILGPGSYVVVPWGHRPLIGIVWGAGTGDFPRLKTIASVLPVAPMGDDLRRLVDWIAAYTLAPLGLVLKMAMGTPAVLRPPPPAPVAYRAGAIPAGRALSAARLKVLAALDRAGRALTAGTLMDEVGCAASTIKAMVEAGHLIPVTATPDAGGGAGGRIKPFPSFSIDQHQASSAISEAVLARRFAPMLLDGVTGSGKTEVYFKAIATAIEAGYQVLVLLPEIALSAQWQERFLRQFAREPAAWHSEIGDAARRRIWRDVANGSLSVVVGARSALFLPFCRLGLIIVDEEHDASFKQEEGVIYQARDMAVVRASLAQVPIVLASATPSLESLLNAERGRYRHLVLHDRHGGAVLPEISLIDLRVAKPARQRFLSPPLQDALGRTLAAGEQAMLFLNRRGYAPLTLCRTCGHRLECPQCSAWLVEHRTVERLLCHHCGYGIPIPAQCPHCADKNSFVPCGPGVERVMEEVTGLFPDARIALMTSDHLVGPKAMADLLHRVEAGAVDFLIGTQMMAKGHHFPMLTLVGVVDADLGLAGGDPRAAERTYQMLHQVSGRAGRAEHPGQVLLQTYDPDHPVMQALKNNDRDAFLALEAEGRHRHGWPPYGRLAALIVSAPDAALVDETCRAIAGTAPRDPGLTVLGPAPAPLAVLRGRHRRRFLIRTDRTVNLQAFLRLWLKPLTFHRTVKVQIDVDPASFL